MLKKLSNYIITIKEDPSSFFKKVGIAILKAQIGWTIAYVLTKRSFGTAYCAPSWFRLFQDEKPPTLLDALQNTDITFSKILILSVAGYALFKGVEYGIKMGFDFCAGVWEGYTGKQSNLTTEEKIDYLYNNAHLLNQMHDDINLKLDNIQNTMKTIDRNNVECGFNVVFEELADIKNGGETLKRVLTDIYGQLDKISHDHPIDFTAQEINRLAQQLEQIRITLLNTNNNLNPAMDTVISRIESIALNLEEQSREELAGISSELRTNMGHIRHIVEQNTNVLNNPILNEEITLPSSLVQQTKHPQPSSEPLSYHGARHMSSAETTTRETPSVENINIPIPDTSSSTNKLVLNSLEPGVYTLNVLSSGGIHIDPVSQQQIQTVANTAIEPNSVFGNLTSGLAGVALNPEVQNAVISYGTRFFTQPQQPYMPQMPYYPPMVPYGQFPQPGHGSSDVSDILARKGGEVAEGAIKVIGKTGGALLRGFFGVL